MSARFNRRGLAAAAAVASVVGLVAAPAGAALMPIKGAADVTAAPWTPHITTSGTDGSVEKVRQLVQCDNTMYAVGTFSEITKGQTTYTRNNAFSFSATNGQVSDWDPDVSNTVNSVALSSDCSTAYLGGVFSTVNGTAVKNIVAVSTSDGSVVSTFKHSAGGKVNTLVLTGDHLLVGGNFKSINGSTKDYLVSLNKTTGKDDGYVNLDISGHYVYTDQGGRLSGNNPTNVYNTSLSPDGSKLLAMGVFTSVGGQGRRQIFMLDLGASSATVDPWYSAEFDQNCHHSEPFWLQDASWSPDQSEIYIATTGYKPASGPGYYTYEPRGGLCDAAAAFPATSSSNVVHDWVNYTGCDSLYSTAADADHVYIGGHERWSDNPLGCDTYLTPGASRVAAPGMAGLSPSGGAINYNPTRGRGKGAADMLRTDAGLWIASDNAQNTSTCAGEGNKRGICFLPNDQL